MRTGSLECLSPPTPVTRGVTATILKVVEPRRPDGEQANEKGYVWMAGEHGGMKDGVDGS